jgi:hypothetical protein
MGHGFPPASGLLPARATAATAGEAREGDFVDFAAVGALDGIVPGPFFLQLGQLFGHGGVVYVELTVTVKAGHGDHGILLLGCNALVQLPKFYKA